MNKYWKFVKDAATVKEKVLGRDHYWHFNAEVNAGADTYLVKVKMPPGGYAQTFTDIQK